jgi:hypothetical protein
VVSNTYFPTGPFGSSGNFANISVDSGHTVTFSGSFAGQGNSDGILNSNGAGTVRLTGSGSNLTLGGNFEIDGDFSNNVYFFNFNGTTVGGSGTFFQLQGLGGTVAPIGRLTVAQYLDSGSTLSIHLNGVTAGVQPGGYDQLVTTQSVNLAGTLQLLLGFQPNPGTLFTIISNTSDTAVQGTFAGLGQGAEFAQGGAEYSINYAGGNDGTDVVVDFLGVPEPTSISAILIVMVIMLRRRRVIRLGS